MKGFVVWQTPQRSVVMVGGLDLAPVANALTIVRASSDCLCKHWLETFPTTHMLFQSLELIFPEKSRRGGGAL